MGLVPDPLVSVHSLGALAEQFRVHNTRILTKQALADSQTDSSPPVASSDVEVPQSDINDSMAIALHLLIGNLAVDLVDQAQLLPVALQPCF